MKKALWLLLAATISTASIAGSKYGYITKVDFHADKWGVYNVNDTGLMSIYIAGVPTGCNQDSQTNGRVIISSDHPLYDSAVSVVLAAKLANKKVHIDYLETCTYRPDGWDFGYIGLRE